MNSYEKFFDYCLKIFIVIGTLFYLPMPPGKNQFEIIEWGYINQELFFRYGVMFLFAISLALSPKRNLTLISGFSFLAFLIFITIFIDFGVQSRRQILNIFIGLVFYKVVVENLNFLKLKDYACWMFWLLFANVVLSIGQSVGIDPIYRHLNFDILGALNPDNVVGFMKLKANLGVMTAVISPILTMLSPWTCIVSLPLLFYGKSSAAAIAFVVSLGFILYTRISKRLFWFIALVLGVAGGSFVIFYDFPGGGFLERFHMWFISLSEVLKMSPFIGLGIGKFAAWQPTTDQVTVQEKLTWIWAHNEFVQVMFEAGIVGLACVLAYIRGRFENFKINLADRQYTALMGCFIAIVIVSFFHFPFHMGKFVGLFLFLMAALHAKEIDIKGGTYVA